MTPCNRFQQKPHNLWDSRLWIYLTHPDLPQYGSTTGAGCLQNRLHKPPDKLFNFHLRSPLRPMSSSIQLWIFYSRFLLPKYRLCRHRIPFLRQPDWLSAVPAFRYNHHHTKYDIHFSAEKEKNSNSATHTKATITARIVIFLDCLCFFRSASCK